MTIYNPDEIVLEAQGKGWMIVLTNTATKEDFDAFVSFLQSHNFTPMDLQVPEVIQFVDRDLIGGKNDKK